MTLVERSGRMVTTTLAEWRGVATVRHENGRKLGNDVLDGRERVDRGVATSRPLAQWVSKESTGPSTSREDSL
jgi:hypothetical protein